MTPSSPRSVRPRLLFAAALAALAVAAALTACTSRPSGTPDVLGTDLPTGTEQASPTPTATPTPTPTPTATPTPKPTTTSAPPKDLAYYLAKIPKFKAAPKPVPVTLSRKSDQAAFAYEIPTSQKVAFLTIDDGIWRNSMALPLLQAAKIPVTLFLTTNYVNGHTGYFGALRDTGYASIENHTVSHPSLPSLSASSMKSQLCKASDNLTKWYGQRPTLFRPPFGNYNDTVLKEAWSCGLQAGFYWRETVDKGKVNYQRDKGHIHAGDIILMHFRPAFPDDFIAALTAIKKSGLVPALLEDYVHVNGFPPPVAPLALAQSPAPTPPPLTAPLADATPPERRPLA
ncbi:MAG TPA: polysaccharide deacetylase family protein [Micromonosporaceae bacterium]